MSQKLVSALVTLALMSAAVPWSALPVQAAEPTVKIGGETLNKSQYAYVSNGKIQISSTKPSSGDNYIQYDVSSYYGRHVLTMKNFNYTSSDISPAIELSGSEFNIDLVGTNTVTACNHVMDDSIMSSGEDYSIGIDCTNFGLRFKGTGTLTVTGGLAPDGSWGIRNENSWVTLEEGCSLIAKGGKSRESSYGVQAKSVSVHNNSTLNAIGGTTGEGYSYGVGATDYVQVLNSTLNATGGQATEANSDSYGVYAGGDVKVESGTLNAKGGTAVSCSYGVSCSNISTTTKTTGKYSVVEADGGSAGYGSYGVYSKGKVSVDSNHTLTSKGGDVTDTYGKSYGVYAKGGMTVAGVSTNTAGKATGEKGESYGVYFEKDLTVSGRLSSTGGDAVEDSYGVYSEGTISVSKNGVLEAIGGKGTGKNGGSCGIRSESDMTVSGNVRATGNTTAPRLSVGVRPTGTGSITIEKTGTLTAAGRSRGVHKADITVNGVLLTNGGGVSTTLKGTGLHAIYRHNATDKTLSISEMEDRSDETPKNCILAAYEDGILADCDVADGTTTPLSVPAQFSRTYQLFVLKDGYALSQHAAIPAA